MREMFGQSQRSFDHPAALFVALVTQALSMMADSLDAQEVAQPND
jgi:hypothetical protein